MLISRYDELRKTAENFLYVHLPLKLDSCARTTEELKTEDQRDVTGSTVVTILEALAHMLA